MQITRSLPVSNEGSPFVAEFTKPAHLHRHPARVYADFETFERGGINHAISYAWVLASHGWKAPKNRFLNIGEDCAESFLKQMFELQRIYRFQRDKALQKPPVFTKR